MDSVETYQIIESYPDDKYLPSYLIHATWDQTIIHILFAVDVANTNVRIVTAYHPYPKEWEPGFMRRKEP